MTCRAASCDRVAESAEFDRSVGYPAGVSHPRNLGSGGQRLPANSSASVDHTDDRGSLLVGRLQVHFHVEAPVVVAGRVVKNLPNSPHIGLPVDDQQRRAPGVGADAHVIVFGEVRVADVLPALGGPAGVGVELSEVVPPAPREQFHPAEERIADHRGERPLVTGQRAWSSRYRHGSVVWLVGAGELLPFVEQA